MLHTVGFLIMGSQWTGCWQGRGTGAKIWGRFRVKGNRRIDFALTFGGADLAPCFALLSTMTAR
jgi:hypothetical protein